MLDEAIETEIAALAVQYGTPRRREVLLGGAPVTPMTKNDRYGEVCMVVRRPGGTLLTAIKSFYPAGGFRLLTGGINYGESIYDALVRETWEETGLAATVQRFLAVIEYRHPELPGTVFATLAFLLDSDGGAISPQDPDERIGAFREIAVAELPAMADTLDAVGDGAPGEIDGSWQDWGRFRAVAHREIYAALAQNHDETIH